MPRKNGKSTLGAALALYALVGMGEEGAQVYSCAGDRTQASIVFNEAKRMVQAEPQLASVIRVQRWHLEGPRNSIYRVLAADAKLQQGLNPSFVIFDEVHVQPNRDLWDAMVLGMGARARPMIVGITTAGYDEGSLAFDLYTRGRAGEFYFWWREPASIGADWRDPKVWAEANPALGDFLFLEALTEDVRITPESQFRRYHLNQWVNSETAWLPHGAWGDASDRELDPKLPVCVGIDLGTRDDSTAVVTAQRQADGVTVLRARFWQNPYPVGHSLRDEWEFDVETVVAYLRELRTKFPAAAVRIDDRTIPGPAFCYDPWGFAIPAQKLRLEGLAMIDVPQTDQRMVPAARTFYDLIVEGRIAHDGDATLAAHLRNVTPLERGDRGWRLTKPRGSSRKIDGAIAATMAVFQAQAPVPKPRLRSFSA